MFKIGQKVAIRGTPGIFTVIESENSRGELLVGSGVLQIRVRANSLKPVNTPTSAAAPVSVDGPPIEVDLHGLTVDLARDRILLAISDALLHGAQHLDLIHGHGTGKLAALVKEILADQPQVKRYNLLPYNTGTTRVYL